MLGLCLLAQEGLSLSLDWDRAGIEGGKTGRSSDGHDQAVQVLSLQLSWIFCPHELASGAD